MPKSTDEEKAARSAALQEATLYATQVPLRTMKTALGVFEIVKSHGSRWQPQPVSDAGVGGAGRLAAQLLGEASMSDQCRRAERPRRADALWPKPTALRPRPNGPSARCWR